MRLNRLQGGAIIGDLEAKNSKYVELKMNKTIEALARSP